MAVVDGIPRTTLQSQYGSQYEYDLLRCLVLDGDFAETYLHLIDPELIELDTVSTLITLHRELAEQHQSADLSVKTLIAEMSGRIQNQKEGSPRRAACEQANALLLQILEEPIPGQADRAFLERTLCGFLKSQRMKTALLRSVEHLERRDFDRIRQEIEVAVDEVGITEEHLGLKFEDFPARIKSYQTRSIHADRISLDLPTLDSIMRGGLEPEKLAIVMAPTGRGKTLFLVHAGAAALAQGKNVVHCTFEISAVDTSLRYDARITGIAINDIATNTKQHLKTLLQFTKERVHGKLRIREWGCDEASVWDIRTYLQLLKKREEFKPDLLLVDYADLVRPYRSHEQRRFEIADTIRGLRQLGKDFNCTVLTASQTNRQGFRSAVLNLAEIAECYEKAQIADIIVGLCQDEDERRQGWMRINVMKNRQGGREGTIVDCTVDTDTQFLQERKRQAASVYGD